MVHRYAKVFTTMSGDLRGEETLSNAEYHAHPAVSKSHLDKVAKSPAHYFEAYLNPDRKPFESTQAMIIGSALHTAVLEPDLWDVEYAVAPEGIDRRYKTGKEAWAKFEEESQGKVLLKAEDAEAVRRMASAVFSHPASSFLLNLKGKREASYFWTDEDTGIECKCRPDWHSEDRRLIVDLKTTEDASPSAFARSVANYRYHVQSAHYCKGLGAEQFLFVCVEKNPPHLVAVYAATPGLMAAGSRAASRDLATIASCRAANHWPGYSTEIQPIDLPSWCND